MPKHGNTFYIELDRGIFDPKHQNLPMGAKLLYVVLTELEHRYTSEEKDYFYHSDKDIATLAKMSARSVCTFKKLLIKAELIQHGNYHWVNQTTGKKSEKKVSVYRVLRSRQK